jgi:chorismate mutase/prephenate dehydratase
LLIAAIIMADIVDLRTQIDTIDDQLVDLLDRRADLALEIRRLKKESGLEIYSPDREEQLLQNLIARSHGRIGPESIRAIYREIMSASLALEKEVTIAFLGPPATWTHQAAHVKFGASVRYLPQTNIADIFSEVARGNADYGVVPIENSTDGAVNHTLDMFVESDLRICAQILLKIENNLLARVPREQIRKLFSHPQVFGQCRDWLRNNMPGVKLIETSSTTRAAELAANDPQGGALAGEMAAEVYQLSIVAASVDDRHDNATRFLVIGRQSCPPTGNDRTSIMFCLQDKPGALFAALRPFDHWKISLRKIESRPSRRKAWEYFMYVDIEGHAEDRKVSAALKILREHCSVLKILGSYPCVDEAVK